jgi:carboxylesterase
MTDTHLIVPGSEPFFFPGGRTGCLLLHGFTAMPEEMRGLGGYLAGQGHTVLGVRLAGHATHPRDLARTRWTDWLISVEDGLAILRGITDRVFVVGMSMGGALALLSAALYPLAGVVAMSTPPQAFSVGSRWTLWLYSRFKPMVHKGVLEAEGSLAGRREADYPAYPQFPPGIVLEVTDLMRAMRAALPDVQVPALLIHSHADEAVPSESMQPLYDGLGTQDKELLAFDDLDRDVVFKAVARFIEKS